MPYQVIVNGQLVGTMTTPQARLRLPAGYYTITIRAGGYLPIGKKGKRLTGLSPKAFRDAEQSIEHTPMPIGSVT